MLEISEILTASSPPRCLKSADLHPQWPLSASCSLAFRKLWVCQGDPHLFTNKVLKISVTLVILRLHVIQAKENGYVLSTIVHFWGDLVPLAYRRQLSGLFPFKRCWSCIPFHSTGYVNNVFQVVMLLGSMVRLRYWTAWESFPFRTHPLLQFLSDFWLMWCLLVSFSRCRV